MIRNDLTALMIGRTCWRIFSNILALIIAFAGCVSMIGAPAVAITDDREWMSAHFSDHPLVGTVWTGDGKASSIAELTAQAIDADFVLLGEVHPNPDHHRIQADLARGRELIDAVEQTIEREKGGDAS